MMFLQLRVPPHATLSCPSFPGGCGEKFMYINFLVLV